jgi:hypothetical protein
MKTPEPKHKIIHQWLTLDQQTLLVSYDGERIHVHEWFVKPDQVPLLIEALQRAHSLAIDLNGLGPAYAAIAAAGGNPANN